MKSWAEVFFAIAVVGVGLVLNTLGQRAYSGFFVSGLLLAVFLLFYWLSNRRLDKEVVDKVERLAEVRHQKLLEKISELDGKFEETIGKTRDEIFYQWRSFGPFKDGQTYAAVVQNDAALVLERTSHEVCVWAYRLVWEIEDPATLEVVRHNLARGVRYRYILPDSGEVRARVREFVAKLGLELDDLRLNFRIRDHRDTLFDQCVTIYHRNGTAADTVVILFPPKVSRGVEEAQYFVQLEGPAAEPIRANFDTMWSSLLELDPKTWGTNHNDAR